MTFIVTKAFTIPASMAGSKAYAQVASTAAATINVIKNGAAASGTIDFAIATNAATFTFGSPVAFVVGDRLQLENQATSDATLADISITIRGDL